MSLLAPQIACVYRNLEDHPQVVRITEADAYLEKTLLPKQCFLFEAPCDACLEIHEGMTCVQSDSIPCIQLLALKADTVKNFFLSEVA